MWSLKALDSEGLRGYIELSEATAMTSDELYAAAHELMTSPTGAMTSSPGASRREDSDTDSNASWLPSSHRPNGHLQRSDEITV